MLSSGSRIRSQPTPIERSSARGLHNCLGRLSRIEAPAMIVHGRHDRLIPVANAELMADQMPHARLEILERSGHLYPTEQPDVDEADRRVHGRSLALDAQR